MTSMDDVLARVQRNETFAIDQDAEPVAVVMPWEVWTALDAAMRERGIRPEEPVCESGPRRGIRGRFDAAVRRAER